MRKTTKKLVPKNGLELEALCGREASPCEPGPRSRNPERSEGPQPRMTFRFHLVPKKGLELEALCGREASACEPGPRSRNPERSEGPQPRMTFRFHLVPKKGLEPPHPCGYMDLNHARLPIPPLRQVDCVAAAASQPPNQEDQLIYFTA